MALEGVGTGPEGGLDVLLGGLDGLLVTLGGGFGAGLHGGLHVVLAGGDGGFHLLGGASGGGLFSWSSHSPFKTLQ